MNEKNNFGKQKRKREKANANEKVEERRESQNFKNKATFLSEKIMLRLPT